MPYPQFDRSRLIVKPLAEREHDLHASSILPLDPDIEPLDAASMGKLDRVGAQMVRARRDGSAVVLMMGAHVLRAGVQRYLIDLMQKGLISHVAMNGAGPIHDFEFALIGATTESVARYIRTGEFGLWTETGRLNDIIAQAAREGIGLGESVGREIEEADGYPHKGLSVLAAAYRFGVPATVHVGIGYDIIHEHPNADGAALGAASYTDFLVIAKSIENLEGGVLLNFGSAVMGPEVYLKALAMARNVARQGGRTISDITTLVCDYVPLGDDTSAEAPKTDPHYYFRPWKTILVRTVADGGEGFYVQGDHRRTFPNLYARTMAHYHADA
ncbi:hypothetical protein FJZ36_12490 [Candidatus Poribacteria bacterium]|nr:hypothetical protein [Candidatus Poribacteria bacterium]